jgi:hypothetical protein
MGVTNRDASLTTARRKQIALYSWRLDNNTNRAEQRASYGSRGTGATDDVPYQAYIGAQLVGQAPLASAATCGFQTTGVTLAGYSKNGYADTATQH